MSVTDYFAALSSHYEWKLTIIVALGLIALTVGSTLLARLVPSIGAASKLNAETYKAKMQKPAYAANQAWNRKWSTIFTALVFVGILPFCLSPAQQPWTRIARDVFIILMFYDFFYYFTHRYLFHDNGVLGGPLKWMHAVHHRQHNPCRNDSSYIHPLEIAVGLGLYIASIVVLSLLLGGFHVVTIIVTFFAFTTINLHNHNLWVEDRLLGGYLGYVSRMHHNHHARFTGGNYATITLLYDWMFGTLDNGEGWQKKKPKA